MLTGFTLLDAILILNVSVLKLDFVWFEMTEILFCRSVTLDLLALLILNTITLDFLPNMSPLGGIVLLKSCSTQKATQSRSTSGLWVASLQK